MQNYGKAIKRIRKNRGMTQKYVGQGILSQAAFSKYEAGLTNIHSTAFVQILERLSMSLEEFEYIINGFEYPESKSIIHRFFDIPYNKVDDLEGLIKETEEYLKEKPNTDLENIKSICKALIYLNQERDIQKAKSYVEPIWIKLSKHDQWYLTDIRLINSILYLFPNDIALEIAKNILAKIENYKEFQGLDRLIVTVKINLSLLLIKDKDFEKALKLLEDVLKTHKKKMSHQSLAISFVRISICRKILQFEEQEYYLEQATLLLNIYDQQILLEQLLQEYRDYTKVL